MAQKSILEEALLQIENLEEAMKQNSKGILSSTMKGELKGLLESEDDKGSDDEKEPKEVEDVPADDDTSVDDEDNVPSDDDTSVDDDDDTSDDDTSVDDDDVESDDEDEDVPSDSMSPMDDMSPSMNEPETLDMTKSSDEEVLRVFKAMKPEDGIIVKKDGNNLEIEVSGDEYIIKLDELEDESMSDEDMSEDDMSEEDMTSEDDMSETDETVYEIELDEEEKEDTHEDEKSHEEVKETKVKKSDKKVEATEAARTKWNAHGNKGGANRSGLPSKKVFKAGSESKVVNEEFNKLKKQNEEYKKALVLFKDKLNEVAVFNANLAYATRLFTEHSTTKQEKLNILKRFDSVSTMNESKKLYNSIKTELDIKKPVTETVVDKITSTSKSSSSKNVLAESKAYENPQFKRMKDLMNKIK